MLTEKCMYYIYSYIFYFQLIRILIQYNSRTKTFLPLIFHLYEDVKINAELKKLCYLRKKVAKVFR